MIILGPTRTHVVELSGKEGGFLMDNWGDFIVLKGAGGMADRLVRQSMFFKARIQTLTETLGENYGVCGKFY